MLYGEILSWSLVGVKGLSSKEVGVELNNNPLFDIFFLLLPLYMAMFYGEISFY